MQKPQWRILFKRLTTLSLSGAVAVLLAMGLQAQEKYQTGEGKKAEHKEHKAHKGEFTAESFLKETAQANLAQVELGQLAMEKSDDPAVKEFAEQMVQDHQQAYEKVQELAESQNVEVSEALEGKFAQLKQKLEQQSGDEFNHTYAKTMLKGHKKEIHKFEKAAEKLDDPELKEYAESTLRSLRHHLEDAEQMALNVGLEQSAITAALQEAEAEAAGAAPAEVEAGEAAEEEQEGEKKGSDKKEQGQQPRP